jgi:hypothetical protein
MLIVLICRVVLAGAITTIVVFIVNQRSLIFMRLSRTSTFSIDLDFQLSSGRRSLSGRIFLQSTSFSGDEQTTAPLHNTTPQIGTQPHLPTDQSPTTIPQNSSETVVDNHEVRFDLEHLPRTWEGLENRRQLPPIAIISEEVEEELEEIRTEEGDYRPQRRPRTPSTPSFIYPGFWESHSARS